MASTPTSVTTDDEDRSIPQWWRDRRFGLFVHANLASVPAWAPIGQYADWYRSHLGEPVADVVLHPSPLVEVLAHHRDRWGHVDRYDDFIDLLTYDRFDADEWAGLAAEAGAGWTVLVAKHHDGWCWWDAPGTDRTVVRHGPERNVLAEYAAACERAGIIFGAYYSLLDWSDERYPTDRYVDEVLHPHVMDLVERYGAAVLWGDGHWGHGPDRWRSDELLERVRTVRPDVVVNDRWWSTRSDLRTFEYEVPDDPPEGEWELCRGIGQSFCWNRAERAEHHLSGYDIVSLLTEVVAKGGHLLLNVGPAADGTVPELQAAPLRDAGRWIRRHHDLVHRGRRWEHWGDTDVRYLRPPADEHAPERVIAIDVSGAGRFAALGRDHLTVLDVRCLDDPDVPGHPWWEQHDDVLHIGGTRPRTRSSTVDAIAVYEVLVRHHTEPPPGLFAPTETAPIPLAPLLEGARRGDVVQLGDGDHLGPAIVPDGVTVRGLGPRRTRLVVHGEDTVRLGRGSRLEHLGVTTPTLRIAWFPLTMVTATGEAASIVNCKIQGHVMVTSTAHRTRIRASRAFGVVVDGADSVEVSRCRLRGNRWDVGVDLRGGDAHLVESCDLRDHLEAVRCDGTTAAVIRGNLVSARWWGIRLRQAEGTRVTGNSIERTMRAVDVDGGRDTEIDGNAVADGDSGCVVQGGANATVVAGNHWSRCRIGLIAWDAGPVTMHGNLAVDLHEPDHEVVIGPEPA